MAEGTIMKKEKDTNAPGGATDELQIEKVIEAALAAQAARRDDDADEPEVIKALMRLLSGGTQHDEDS